MSQSPARERLPLLLLLMFAIFLMFALFQLLFQEVADSVGSIVFDAAKKPQSVFEKALTAEENGGK